MSSQKSQAVDDDSDSSSSDNTTDICGATNRHGNPCKQPAGWGTPGSGGNRCKLHGGCSTGPDDTSHLENNNFAKGNSGGRPPENNDNAAIHHGFSQWKPAYERFQEDKKTRQRIETLKSSYLETASEHADDLDDDRRERLAREMATRRLLIQRAQKDVWNDGDSDARGLILKDGAKTKVNPAHIAAHTHKRRTREIAKELSLWSGYR